MVELLSKPKCVQCTATERALDDKGIEYTHLDLREPENLQRAKDAGHLQAPVVFTPTESWSGFRPDRIEALASSIG